ncbi:alpha-amylase [Pontibacter ummariensis]|uniref:Alpha-amylase n=2 Tax=Pontibacter ummariensis TaxID=1610492 RepID=A0A239G545_9BACT|nr:alpha-amylase [Pontibacter ummariensis]PRY11647.1 alpha-amylase [Pontibacter ummariensis]SNS63888.1 alpha-amylase [Pontibacter ummariensis]
MNYLFKTKHIPAACLLSMAFVLFAACSDKDEEVAPTLPATESAVPSEEVMMQAFYWDVPAGGTWWDHVNTKLDSWASAGITTVWLPPVTKGQSGQYSMGYDPFDYFDFGQYNQHGTTETRFGSEAELVSLLQSAKSKDIKLIADIVLNHNSGGDSEFNPYTNKNTWTKFSPASGKFNRTYEDFHANRVHAADEGFFGGFSDLCHDVQYVQNWLWNRPDGVGKYYKNTLGFHGWRFDYVKGFHPSVVKKWNAAVGGVSIGEYWDADVELVYNWCLEANSGAFDFPLYYALDKALDENMMYRLENKGLIAKDPSLAYTFVANHDTDEISARNKLQAYAYILTAEGTPFIFYKDYETLLDKTKLNTLIWIKKNLAAGSSTKLFASATEYIFSRNGTPGLVTYINNGTADKERKVQTRWANTVLKDFTGINPDITTDASGLVTIPSKANSYAVYSPK